MNTRLQVEHPITELRAGIDLVAEQLRVAMGQPLSFTQEDIQFRGHAIECRICAEDVEDNFLPSTGKIVYLRPPQGPGIREDRGVEEGGEISLFYDPMISKLIVWGRTRSEAIARMRRALSDYAILGVKTNIELHQFVLAHESFTSGVYDTHFLQEHVYDPTSLPLTAEERIGVAAICALVETEALVDAAGRGSTFKLNGAMESSRTDSKWMRRRVDHMRSK
jgi:acetyl/propionyl-CoA carboxylase alpha subunit